MGGSSKGEHRGEVKRQAKRRSGGPPKGTVNNPGGRPKGTQNKAIRERLAIIGAEIGVAEMSGVMPKEILLQTARTFMQMALNEQAKIAQLQELPEEEQDGARLDALTVAYERHLVLASDTAYKAGNYYHARLQALVVGDAKSPADVLRSMLEEIDDEGRIERQQSRVIEHAPQPREHEDEVVLPMKVVGGES